MERTVTLRQECYQSVGQIRADPSMGGVFADIDYWRALYPAVFPSDDNPLGHTETVIMKIQTGGTWPIHQRPYRVALAKRRFVELELDRMLREGVIEPSSSPWASPIHSRLKVTPIGCAWIIGSSMR